MRRQGIVHTAFNDVLIVIADYFDMLYESDAARIEKLFHPNALYASATDGSILLLTMSEYRQVMAQRISPKSLGEQRRDAVEEIAFAGTVTATARLRCAIGPKFFTDFLTLVKLDERWQIISKVFHYDAIDA
jgi:Putative lumazine-binding